MNLTPEQIQILIAIVSDRIEMLQGFLNIDFITSEQYLNTQNKVNELIPIHKELVEPANPNQPLIDEYRGLIERRQMQITQIERQFGTKRLSSEFDELNNDKIRFETQISDYQQFITKLEGLL